MGEFDTTALLRFEVEQSNLAEINDALMSGLGGSVALAAQRDGGGGIAPQAADLINLAEIRNDLLRELLDDQRGGGRGGDGDLLSRLGRLGGGVALLLGGGLGGAALGGLEKPDWLPPQLQPPELPDALPVDVPSSIPVDAPSQIPIGTPDWLPLDFPAPDWLPITVSPPAWVDRLDQQPRSTPSGEPTPTPSPGPTPTTPGVPTPDPERNYRRAIRREPEPAPAPPPPDDTGIGPRDIGAGVTVGGAAAAVAQQIAKTIGGGPKPGGAPAGGTGIGFPAPAFIVGEQAARAQQTPDEQQGPVQRILDEIFDALDGGGTTTQPAQAGLDTTALERLESKLDDLNSGGEVTIDITNEVNLADLEQQVRDNLQEVDRRVAGLERDLSQSGPSFGP